MRANFSRTLPSQPRASARIRAPRAAILPLRNRRRSIR